MAAAEFPFPSVLSSNPSPTFFEELAEEFVVGRTIYDDGGADYRLQAGGAGKKGFSFKYEGLTLAQAALIDAYVATLFYSEDNGSAVGFNFRTHVPGTLWTDTSGTLYSNCHIAPGGFKKSHVKSWNCTREFLVEKRP